MPWPAVLLIGLILGLAPSHSAVARLLAFPSGPLVSAQAKSLQASRQHGIVAVVTELAAFSHALQPAMNSEVPFLPPALNDSPGLDQASLSLRGLALLYVSPAIIPPAQPYIPEGTHYQSYCGSTLLYRCH